MITVTPTPIEAFPINRTPFSNMVPFTYWDHATNADILTRLRHWLYTDFTNWVNENFENAAEQWNAELQTLISRVDKALLDQSNQVNAAIENLEEYVDTNVTDLTGFVTDIANDLTDLINTSLNDQDVQNDVKIAALTLFVNNAVQSIINSTIEVSDPVILGVVSDDDSETTKWLDSRYGFQYNILNYGAIGNETADDTAAINAALAAAVDGGTVIFPGGYIFRTTGGHIVPKGVRIMFGGSVVKHTGNNVCFSLNYLGTFNNDRSGGIEGLTLIGNDGVNAVGVEFGNAWGIYIKNSDIQQYTQGVGLRLDNTRNWCEGTQVEALKMDFNKVGVQFTRSGGTTSFAYTHFIDLAINVRAECVGIDMGSTGASVMYLYNSSIRATIWILGTNSVGILIGAQFTTDNNQYEIKGEIPGNAGSTVGAYGIKNLGGRFYGYGYANVKNVANDLALGATRILAGGVLQDTRLGTNAASDVFKAGIAANIDNAHDAVFGFITGSNRSIPFVSGFDQSDAFRVYKAPNGGTPSTGTELFKVRNDGAISFGPAVAGRIATGAGAPTMNGPFGALYLRNDDAAGFPQLYVKLSDQTNQGWTAIDPRKTVSTASRPTIPAGQQRGMQVFDLNLNVPIWWTGTAWVNGSGVAV